MPPLDPNDLRRYASRDWSAPDRLSRVPRAAQPLAQRIALGIALYEAAKTTRPDWPTRADREADCQNHVRIRRLLDRVRHVGTR